MKEVSILVEVTANSPSLRAEWRKVKDPSPGRATRSVDAPGENRVEVTVNHAATGCSMILNTHKLFTVRRII